MSTHALRVYSKLIGIRIERQNIVFVSDEHAAFRLHARRHLLPRLLRGGDSLAVGYRRSQICRYLHTVLRRISIAYAQAYYQHCRDGTADYFAD